MRRIKNNKNAHIAGIILPAKGKSSDSLEFASGTRSVPARGGQVDASLENSSTDSFYRVFESRILLNVLKQ